MARKKAASSSGSSRKSKKKKQAKDPPKDEKERYQRPRTDKERVARKRKRWIRGCKLKVYALPDQAKLDAFDTWAIVRQNPERVRETRKLDADPDARWWLPVTWAAVDWRQIFWLDVVSIKIAGRMWPSLCRACDLTLLCAEEGRGINPKHECAAKRENLVDIVRKKKGVVHDQQAAGG